MEYIRGQTLRQLIDACRAGGGRLSLAHAVHICAEVSRALSQAHQLGASHGDLSPERVVIAMDGDVKLTDFGYAQAGRPAGRAGSYRAPELALGAQVDPRSDVFAVGALLLELCTGRSLDPDQPIPEPSEWNARIPQSLSEAIKHATHPQRERRTPSAQSLAKELSAVLLQLVHAGECVDLPGLLLRRGPVGMRAAGPAVKPVTALPAEPALRPEPPTVPDLPSVPEALELAQQRTEVFHPRVERRDRKRVVLGAGLAAAMLLLVSEIAFVVLRDPGAPPARNPARPEAVHPVATSDPQAEPSRPAQPIAAPPPPATAPVPTQPQGVVSSPSARAVAQPPSAPVAATASADVAPVHRSVGHLAERRQEPRPEPKPAAPTRSVRTASAAPASAVRSAPPPAERRAPSPSADGPAPEGATQGQSSLLVSSRPWGIVFVDKRRVGYTPVAVQVAPGSHAIRIERDGYEPAEHTLSVRSGDEGRWSPSLVAVEQ
jgi:serine/threonine-protein kinase